MKPIAAAIAFLGASLAAAAPAVASACITAAAFTTCPASASAGSAACGSCATSSFYGDVSALGVGILVGVGSVAAEGLLRSARGRSRGRIARERE